MAVDLNVTYRIVAGDDEIVLAVARLAEGPREDDEVVGLPELEDALQVSRRILPAGSSVLAPGMSTPVL